MSGSVGAEMLPASAAVLLFPALNFDAIEAAWRVRDRASKRVRGFCIALQMHESHWNATDVNARRVAQNLVFAKSAESLVEHGEAANDAYQESTGRIRVA